MEQRTTKIEPYVKLMSEVIRRAVKDVYDWEVKKKGCHTSQYDYNSALSYLNSDRCTAHLQMIGINMTGKEILQRIRDGRIADIGEDDD